MSCFGAVPLGPLYFRLGRREWLRDSLSPYCSYSSSHDHRASFLYNSRQIFFTIVTLATFFICPYLQVPGRDLKTGWSLRTSCTRHSSLSSGPFGTTCLSSNKLRIPLGSHSINSSWFLVTSVFEILPMYSCILVDKFLPTLRSHVQLKLMPMIWRWSNSDGEKKPKN